ncbi:NAD(P)/FAD-dependent oxidoreductase [Mycetocola reblochoni]|uniref:Thioredoxin reductase n=2 Tax=Mycetocola reblochoni TaxID=331618 RepID=A0A1R4JAN1_9MICO|nr:NAD(P)/FAD-dependent oxidoreductase [Mycetocola reblochoni]RLP70030.1 NAD(P)/FAD-dependent oxidoreductase [Mycetocola reblochoni]SJN29107.1 Thioredoxin reductase [Mycetocola reblochoni REB411]
MTGAPERVDVVVVGGGPAGLSAALTIVRSGLTVRVLDANRPRHAATLLSHGFLTRDGIPPSELRRIGREQLEEYADAAVSFAAVASVDDAGDGEGFRVRATGVRGEPDVDLHADRVFVATGLREVLPRVPGLRAYYGTALHSCFSCDAYEKRGLDLALIGTDDGIVDRALLIASVARSVTLFPHDAAVGAEARVVLSEAGVRVVDGQIAALEGDRGGMTGVRVGEELHPLTAGFVVPRFETGLEWLDGVSCDRDGDGLIVVDGLGRASRRGVYAAGEVTRSGPSQLIVAAGEGARAAATLVRDHVLGDAPGGGGLAGGPAVR